MKLDRYNITSSCICIWKNHGSFYYFIDSWLLLPVRNSLYVSTRMELESIGRDQQLISRRAILEMIKEIKE